MESKTFAGLVILLVWLFLFLWVALACKNIKVNPFKELGEFFKKQSTFGRIVFLLFFLVMTIYGSTKPSGSGSTTNDVGNASNSSNSTNGSNSIVQTQSGQISSSAQLGSLSSSIVGADGDEKNLNNVQNETNNDYLSGLTSTLLSTDFTDEQKSVGFVLAGIITNESYDFSLPTNGVVYTPWLIYGAADDMFVYEQDWTIINHGTNVYQTARIHSQGSIAFGTNIMVNVFNTILGIPPTNNWNGAGEPMLWYKKNNDSIIYTWQDVLLSRVDNENISFQVEIKTNGDIISRYDARVTEYIQNQTNLIYNISNSNHTNEEVAINNTCSSTNHTCAIIYDFSPSGGISALPLCNIVDSLQGGFSLYWKNISNLNHTSSDEDNDGISNFEEICIYKTDCYNSDTDGDNRSDYLEIQNGFSAINADENNDGIPDGVDSDEWASHPLWCTNNTPSIVISLNTPIPVGTSASLMLNDLTIPLSETNSWSLTLPQGELVNARLQSTGTEPIDLSLSYPNSDTQNYNNSVWIDDPAGIFDGEAHNQDVARMCVPTVRFYDDKTKTFVRSICLHHSSESYIDLRIVFSPKEFQDSIIVENITLEELELIGENLVRISIKEESDASFGYLTYEWFSQYFEYGCVFGMVNIHRCNSIHNEGYCIICSNKCIDFDNIKVDINGDYNRSGNLIDDENEGKAVLFNNSHGMVIPVNNNDTNLDGVPDCNDEEINGLDDLNELKRIRIEALNIPPYFADYVSAKLKIYTLASDIDTSRIVTDKVRIYDGTTIFAEPFNFVHDGGGIYSTNLSDDQVNELCTNHQELLIEGCWHGSQINISLEIRINGTLFKRDYISILNAPFFVLSNCDEATKIFMGYHFNWNETYNTITNSNLLDIPFEIVGQPYLQDYAEFGASIDALGNYYPVIMDFNSNNFNDELFPNTGLFSLAIGGEGGNIEGLPVSAQHPYGRVIVGSTLKNRQPQIYNFIKNQKIQGDLIELNTDWLQVGHVDEIISIVPTSNSYKIFVFDTELAIDIYVNTTNDLSVMQNTYINDCITTFFKHEYQQEADLMINRTSEIVSILKNNNINESQIVLVPVLFTLVKKSEGNQNPKSSSVLFNPINSLY